MKIWVYLDGRQQGPFELEQLFDMPVDENTKVWFDGLPRWCAAGEIEELRCLFDGSRPAPAKTSAESEPSETADNAEPTDTTEEAAAEQKPESPYTPGRRMPRRELPTNLARAHISDGASAWPSVAARL